MTRKMKMYRSTFNVVKQSGQTFYETKLDKLENKTLNNNFLMQ